MPLMVCPTDSGLVPVSTMWSVRPTLPLRATCAVGLATLALPHPFKSTPDGRFSDEVPGHAASVRRRRMVSTIRSTDGSARSSRAAADGSGMCGVVIRTIGASRL
jgi:hypothetical protein